MYVATGQEVQGRDLTPEEVAIALERDPHLARAYEGQARTAETLGPDVGGGSVPEQDQGLSRDPEDPDAGSGGTPAPTPEPPLPTLPTAGATRELTDKQLRALEALQQGARITQEISEGRDMDRESGDEMPEQGQMQARTSEEMVPSVVLEQGQSGDSTHQMTVEGRKAAIREAGDLARELADGKTFETTVPGENTGVNQAPQAVELTPAQRALELVDRAIHAPTPIVVPETPEPKQSRSLLDKARGALGLGKDKQDETHGLSKDAAKEARLRADLANALWDQGTPKAFAISIARGVDPRAHEALVRQLAADRATQDAQAGVKRSAAEREVLARGDALSVLAEGARIRSDEQAARVQAQREAAAQPAERPRVPVPAQLPENIRTLIEVSHESPAQREQRLQHDMQRLVQEHPELAQSLDQAREAVLARWAEDARTAPGRLRSDSTALGVDKGIDRTR